MLSSVSFFCSIRRGGCDGGEAFGAIAPKVCSGVVGYFVCENMPLFFDLVVRLSSLVSALLGSLFNLKRI